MKDFTIPLKDFNNKGISEVMPKMDEIPDEFNNGYTKWNKATSKWFFSGIEKSVFKPKEGIDPQDAFRHLASIMQSWEPKHEHKEAAVSYLMSLWFDDVKL